MSIDKNTAGPQALTTGSTSANQRAAATGELVSCEAHGRFHEAASRGKLFSASMQAGASLGTTLAAGAVTLTLYNPLNSGYWLSLIEVGIAITTGLTAASTSALVLAGNVNTVAAAPSSNTLATIRNCLLGNAATGVGIAYTATTLPATPIVLAPIWSDRVIGATPVAEAGGCFTYMADGKWILAPNTAITVQGIGAAISGIVSMLWEEIPILG
jgi:hypothetical protein